MAAFVAPDVTSFRHKQNRYYAQMGFEALYDKENSTVIEGVDRIARVTNQKESGKLCMGLLEQLGRTLAENNYDVEYVRDLARQATELLHDDPSMTVRRLERALRQIRKENREGRR
jgi:hypothetical protein